MPIPKTEHQVPESREDGPRIPRIRNGSGLPCAHRCSKMHHEMLQESLIETARPSTAASFAARPALSLRCPSPKIECLPGLPRNPRYWFNMVLWCSMIVYDVLWLFMMFSDFNMGSIHKSWSDYGPSVLGALYREDGTNYQALWNWWLESIGGAKNGATCANMRLWVFNVQVAWSHDTESNNPTCSCWRNKVRPEIPADLASQTCGIERSLISLPLSPLLQGQTHAVTSYANNVCELYDIMASLFCCMC